MRHCLASTIAFLIFLSSTTWTLAQEADITARSRGGRTTTLEGFRVTQDSLKGLQARKGPQRMSFKAADVVSVKWRKAPAGYGEGLAAFGDGDYEKAAQSFTNALGQASRYSWLPVYGNWYLGESLRRIGDHKGALAAYDALLKANPMARQAPEAYVAQANLHLRSGKGGAAPARQALNRLLSLVKKERLPERYTMLGNLGLARIEARVGDPDKAMEMLGSLAGRDRDNAEVANLAKLEIGGVLLRQRKFGEAENFFKGILESDAARDPDIIAGASNGLGDCQYAQGQYDKAMFTYSKVYALFIDRPDQAARVAHAMLQGGQSFRLQAGKESDPEKKRLLLKRSREVLRRLIREFPGTPAAAEAKKAL